MPKNPLKNECNIRAGSILSERQDHSKGTRWGGGHLFSLDPPAFSRRESVQDVFLSCRSAPLLLRIAVFIRRLPSPDFRRGAQIVALVIFARMNDVFVRSDFARPFQLLIRHEPIHGQDLLSRSSPRCPHEALEESFFLYHPPKPFDHPPKKEN